MIIVTQILHQADGYDGDRMRRNEAHKPIPQDQIDEMPMEPRIARIESDVAHMKLDIANVHLDMREFRNDMKAANQTIAGVKDAVVAVDKKVGELTVKVDANAQAADTRFDALDLKVNSVDAKVDRLDARLEAVQASLSTKIDATDTSLDTKIDTVHASLNAKIDATDASLNTMMQAILRIGRQESRSQFERLARGARESRAQGALKMLEVLDRTVSQEPKPGAPNPPSRKPSTVVLPKPRPCVTGISRTAIRGKSTKSSCTNPQTDWRSMRSPRPAWGPVSVSHLRSRASATSFTSPASVRIQSRWRNFSSTPAAIFPPANARPSGRCLQVGF